MKNITELTKEEYEEMAEYPEVTWEMTMGYLEEMFFTEKEAKWLEEHDYNIDNLIILPHSIFGGEENGHS